MNLMKTKKSTTKSNKLLPLTIIGIILLTKTTLFAQNTEWGIDEIKRIEQEKKHEHDSLMVHLKNNWQISLCYGQWNFNNSAKSNDETILDFPNNMGSWSLSFARYFSESISVNANIGIQIKKVEPNQPDFYTVLSGGDIDIEGGGLTFIPLSIGMDYFFLKQRFRPFLGVGIGSVSAKSKLIEASGNMYDGIDSDQLESSSNSPFVELSSGFFYRTGKNTQLGLNCDYVHSKEFCESVGGFKSYSGLKISGIFSIVF
jgi:outer membrane protein W